MPAIAIAFAKQRHFHHLQVQCSVVSLSANFRIPSVLSEYLTNNKERIIPSESSHTCNFACKYLIYMFCIHLMAFSELVVNADKSVERF